MKNVIVIAGLLFSSIAFADVSPQQMVSDFEDNEAAAEQKYSGTYNLTGTVKQVRTSNFLGRTVTVEVGSVQATLADENGATGLRKGQRITLTCTGASQTLFVYARKCVIR